MKRKLIIIALTVLICVFGFQSMVLAEKIVLEGIDLEDYDHEVPVFILDPNKKEVFFNEKLLSREVVIDGKKHKDVLIVIRTAKNFILGSAKEDYDLYGSYYKNKFGFNTFNEFAKLVVADNAIAMHDRYPNYEIISINGKPWQETEYKDVILDTFEKENENRLRRTLEQEVIEELANTPELNGFRREISQNKMTKEQAAKIGKDLQQGIARIINPRVKLQVGNRNIEVPNADMTDMVQKQLDVAPMILKGNRTYIPVRGAFEGLGCTVNYDPITNKFEVKTENVTFENVIGTNVAIINGKKVTMENPSVIRGNRSLIPLRFVGEALGYNVTWIQAKQEIIIEKAR